MATEMTFLYMYLYTPHPHLHPYQPCPFIRTTIPTVALNVSLNLLRHLSCFSLFRFNPCRS